MRLGIASMSRHLGLVAICFRVNIVNGLNKGIGLVFFIVFLCVINAYVKNLPVT